MRCDNCGEREAAIHLTQIENNTIKTAHLCEQCAAQKGVETGAAVAKYPLGDFLASLGGGGGGEGSGKGAAPEQEAAESVACPFCGGTLQDFRETGRLGCAQCYVTFEGHLRDLLRRLHGSSRHVGERYLAPAGEGHAEGAAAAAAGGEGAARELSELREQLKRAIETENFELAAELRDRLKVLE